MSGIPIREFERLFSGSDRLEAVQCPVRFEVWKHFALWGPYARVDVLVERATSVGVAREIVGRLNKRLDQLAAADVDPAKTTGLPPMARVRSAENVRTIQPPNTGGVGSPTGADAAPDREPDPKATVMGRWVLVSCDLRELIIAMMPGTSWEPVVKALTAIATPGLRRVLTGTGSDDSEPQPDDASTSGDVSQKVSWIARLLARLWGYDPDVPWERSLAARNLPGHLNGSAMSQSASLSISSTIESISTDRRARAAVVRSERTIKADAARDLFSIDCSHITWAVIDSGIQARHPAFVDTTPEQTGSAVFRTRISAAVDFCRLDKAQIHGLSDRDFVETVFLEAGIDPPRSPGDTKHPGPPTAHGTHVAGILAGAATGADDSFRGICPTLNLWDLRVLDRSDESPESRVLMALRYVRLSNEIAPKRRVHGVNLSLAIPYDPKDYSCGWTPVCQEVRALVRSGVVVVAAAGNAGFEIAAEATSSATTGSGYRMVGITDPGNTDEAITVGSTHRSLPGRSGVSYFSSKGPTADGRSKPDLLAPGEGIVSSIGVNATAKKDGTSQAAPHVSAAAAMLMARHPELEGDPERVKRILCDTATDLGRDRYFQGAGLVDVLPRHSVRVVPEIG